MLRLGILDKQRFLQLGEKRWRYGPHVAYNLLAVGDHPSPEDTQVFEDLSFVFRTANGTFRTSFRNRFQDINKVVLRHLQERFSPNTVLRVQDRAVSHGLTSAEWILNLQPAFPQLTFEASDLMMELLELKLDSGEIYIAEKDGTALQYIRAPFVVPIHHSDARRFPINQWVAGRAKRRLQALHLPANWTSTTSGDGYTVRSIPMVHPEMRALVRQHHPQFQFRIRSVFETTPPHHVIRTLNILHQGYFTPAQLQEAFKAVFNSLEPGGLWILGRTLEEDLANHASLLLRKPDGWDVLERIGNGADVEHLALGQSAV